MTPLIIYTDGSCLGNPGPGGWAAIIQVEGEEVTLSGHEQGTTNNRMEINAVAEALAWIKLNKKSDQKIEVYSDSSLVIKTMNDGWKRKANTDIWAKLDEAREGLDITWQWVKGHANNPLNERCDEIAVAEATVAAQSSPGGTPKNEVTSEGFHCKACGQTTDGKRGYLPDTGMIRVDCLHCGRYIKFAKPTPTNLKSAKKRPLLTKREMEAFSDEFKINHGRTLTENELKQLKAMTYEEAERAFNNTQSLF